MNNILEFNRNYVPKTDIENNKIKEIEEMLAKIKFYIDDINREISIGDDLVTITRTRWKQIKDIRIN